jgi:hypothetical protein
MTQWNDFLLRTTLDDNGSLPRQWGWQTPDIIAVGLAPSPNPSSYTTSSSYATDPGGSPVYNATNYIYLRAQNLYSGANEGTAFLYCSTSELINYPSVWEGNPIGNPNGLAITSSSLGQIVMPASAFVWPQTPPQPAGFHYCLIAWIKTKAHGTLPSGDAISDFAAFVTQNGNWAQRNIAIVDINAPTFTKSVNYAQGSQAATMNFSVTWTTPPIGSAVRFVARDPINGTVVDSGLQTITASNFGFVVPQIAVPAGYQTVIDIYYYANGLSATSPFSFTLNVFYFVPPTENALMSYARTMHEHGIGHLPIAMTNHQVVDAASAIGPQRAILVGTQKIAAQ